MANPNQNQTKVTQEKKPDHPHRMMPVGHAQTGKHSKEDFVNDGQTAIQAFAQGQTAARKVVIEQTPQNTIRITTARQHNPDKPGISPALMATLAGVLVNGVKDGTLTLVQTDSEKPHPDMPDHDEWTVEVAAAR